MPTKTSRLAAAAAAIICGLSLTACSSSAAAPATEKEVEVGDGNVISFTFNSGLACDLFVGYKAGSIECNTADFTAPEEWVTDPGVVETVEVGDEKAYIYAHTDGHYCVVFEGYKAGGIDCYYPSTDTTADTAEKG